MELRHIRYFIAAAEEEHFGRASDRLHVTRPAVSQIIADLESELRTPLFERLTHRVRLTAAGRAFLPQVQEVMRNLNEAVTMVRRIGEGKTGTLNIGYGSLTLLHSLFRAAIKEYHESFPEVTLSLYEIATLEQPRALAEGKIHAGFMHFGPQTEALRGKARADLLAQEQTVLDWVPIQSGGLGVVMPADHPLAASTALALDELANENFIVVPRSSSSPGYGPLLALCQQAGFQPKIVQEVSSVASQLNLISAGMGIGLAVIGKNFSYPSSVAVVPLKEVAYTTNFVFGWVQGQADPALEQMVKIVQALARRP